MVDTAYSLEQTAASLSTVATAFGAQAETVGAIISSASGSIEDAASHWGGPAAQEVLGAAVDYIELVSPIVDALESAQSTVSRWVASAADHSSRLATYESTLEAIAADIEGGIETPAHFGDRRHAEAMVGTIRSEWQTACTGFATEMDGAITALFGATTALLALVDIEAMTDFAYYARIAELASVTGVDVAVIDPSGAATTAVLDRATLLGSDDGAWIFAVLETSNEGDLDKADGNLAEDDIIAACDPATVRALLTQGAADEDIELDPAQLDALVSEVVATAWMMRSSEEDVWEDIDDDIEWYERGVFEFVREEVFAPVAAFAVGGLCLGAAGVTAAPTGGASLSAVGYCGGLAAATYGAADTWANGGDGGDVFGAFTDPQTWAWGAASGIAFQGATNYLLRAPAVSPTAAAAAGVGDDAYHYTFREYTGSMARGGLWEDTFATPTSGLAPLQAQIELALPPNSGLRNAVIHIDLGAMRAAGYEIPPITRVASSVSAGGRVYSMPGGGFEMQFPYRIPAKYLKVVIE